MDHKDVPRLGTQVATTPLEQHTELHVTQPITGLQTKTASDSGQKANNSTAEAHWSDIAHNPRASEAWKHSRLTHTKAGILVIQLTLLNKNNLYLVSIKLFVMLC